MLEQAIEKHKPNAVICVGQAGGRSVISIEKVAINWAEAGIPDNEGQKPDGKVIIEDGATAYFSTLPIKAMAKKIKEYGIPSGISYTAGTFVCNDIMYRLLYMIERKYPKIRGGFVHVPFALSQAVSKPDGTPGMPIDIIAKGLEYAVEAICECEMDIAGI